MDLELESEELIEIDVDFTDLEEVQGYTHETGDAFYVEINEKFLNTEHLKTIIAHELIHVAQLIRDGNTNEPEAYDNEKRFAEML